MNAPLEVMLLFILELKDQVWSRKVARVALNDLSCNDFFSGSMVKKIRQGAKIVKQKIPKSHLDGM